MTRLPAAGDSVRLLGVPDYLTHDLPREDQVAIRAQIGRTLVVEQVRQDGAAELTFDHSLGEREETWTHTIWLEPEWLEIVLTEG